MNIRANSLTAFLSGFSLSVAAGALDIAMGEGYIPFNAESDHIFPFFAAYFLITGIVFVIGFDVIKKQFNKYRSSVNMIQPMEKEIFFAISVRVFIWFVGGAIGILCCLFVSGI